MGISLLFFYLKCVYVLYTFFWFLKILHTHIHTNQINIQEKYTQNKTKVKQDVA